MATLKIWNIEDEIVLSDESETIHALDGVLESFKDEHHLYSSGGLGYEIKIHTNDDLLAIRDELEDEEGNIVGRYEMEV